MIIALDGPAASGKGTLAKALAKHFKLDHLDTGLLYRAVGVAAFREGLDFDNETAIAEIALDLDLTALDHPILRSREAGELASKVGAIPAVREALLTLQRDFANNPKGAVLDGRDIGTVIAPHADVKIYVTASSEERAKRRHNDLPETSYEDLLTDIKMRDARDQSRSSAPLKPADDALILDTTNMNAKEAFKAVIDFIALKNA